MKEMKKFLSLIVLTLLISSCQEDLKSNTPGFQALKDDVFWRATDARAYLSSTGKLTIKGLTEYEELDLSTSSTAEGVYLLGTTNNNNKAVYTSSIGGTDLQYETLATPGPAFGVYLLSGGAGYSDASSVPTTGGSGSGLTVSIKTDPNNPGIVTRVSIASGGNGYVSGDLIYVNGGNGACRFRVSNGGLIEITEYDEINQTISGTFKLNASNVNNNPAGGPILNFQYGAFYQVQIYPEL
jgi:hypothetical protein